MENKISKSFQIETDRFVLRIPDASDIPHVFSATTYAGFNDGMLWEAPQEASELIVPLKNNMEAWESGKGYCFTIVKKGLDQLLGRISIRKTAVDRVWNVGFWTHPEWQRQGVMTEALGAVIQFGFEELDALSIEAYHAVWNEASAKVLKQNGMKFVSYIKEGFQKNGVWIDENKLSIDRNDWSS